MQILSQKLKGVPKSAQHKARIAASQRRRYAARRALQAIEDLHSTASPFLDNRGRSRYRCSALTSMISSNSNFQQKQTRAEVGSMVHIAISPCTPVPKSHICVQVLNTYKCLLREYRELQEELSPWMHAFEEDHSRRPTLVDVESTKIPWLVDKYKDYIVMREKLFIGIPELRRKIKTAQADVVLDQSACSPTGVTNTAEAEPFPRKIATATKYVKDQAQKVDAPKARAVPPLG